MAALDTMTFAPVRLLRQWSVEGGRLGKAHGLDTKEIDTVIGPLSFVKINKNADLLLHIVTGSAAKGALRRSLIFRAFGKHVKEASADPASHWSPIRTPERSSPSAVAGASEPAVDPMHQFDGRKRHVDQGRHCSRHCGANRPLLR